MKKEYVIPIFVPNSECENDCTLCNQMKIGGKTSEIKSEDVKKIISEYLENFKDDNKYVEVAFLGSNFTRIEEKKQIELLEVVNEFIKNKKVNSIRIVVRPDCIDKKTLKMLKKYHVKTIELCVQSTDNYVLSKNKLGYAFEDIKKASKMIRFRGFKLGHQMMIGMPESTEKAEIDTAKDLIKLKPIMVRIYPVLVIKGTALAREYSAGEYVPLTIGQAVERCKQITYMFRKNKIDVIRIGLQNSDEMNYTEEDGRRVLAGPFHLAFRQLVEGEMWYDSIAEKVKEINTKVKKIEIEVNPSDVNNVIGHKKANIIKLEKMYEVEVVIKQNEELASGKFNVNVIY